MLGNKLMHVEFSSTISINCGRNERKTANKVSHVHVHAPYMSHVHDRCKC